MQTGGSKQEGHDPEESVVSVDEVLPGLWLGNQAAATSDFVRRQGIEVVVNCTAHIPCPHAGVRYFRVPVGDPGAGHGLEEENVRRMVTYLPMAVAAVTEARRRGAPVLVHCHAGAQRSACVVVAYAMSLVPLTGQKGTRTALARLIQWLIERRSRAFFGGESVNFYAALVRHLEL